MQLRIGQKISAGFAIILVLLLVISLVTIFSTRSISNEVQGLSHVYNQLALESEIESEFDRAVAGIRGYVAYGTNNFQEDYNVSMGKVMNAENELLAVVGGRKNPRCKNLLRPPRHTTRALLVNLYRQLNGIIKMLIPTLWWRRKGLALRLCR